MRRYLRRICAFAAAFLLCGLYPTIAYANAAEPPCLTILVSCPPEELELSIRFADGTELEPVLLRREDRAWEAYYRFFYSDSMAEDVRLEGAVLLVQTAENSFRCALPATTFKIYNNLMTLDLAAKNCWPVGRPGAARCWSPCGWA